MWTTNLYNENTGRVHQSVTDRETENPNRISALTYGYDTVGNITSITDTQSSSRIDRQCFAYDPMGRLVHAWTARTDGCPTTSGAQGSGPNRAEVSPGIDGGGYWQSYAFDAIGNRTRMTVHDLANENLDDVHTYTYGTEVTGGPQPAPKVQPHTLTKATMHEVGDTTTIKSQSTYAYDTSGNTTRRVIDGDTQALTWDRRNKLSSVDTDNNGTANVKYLYDASGNRLIEDNGTTRTLFLGEAEITVNTSGQALDAQRYYGHPGAPTTVRSTGGKSTDHKLTVMLADHHNTSTSAIEQTAGQAITRRTYDPYGNPRGTEPTNWPGRHSYLGVGIDDPSTGLTHIGAREYDATTGRFVSADPLIDITDPLQMNGYTYANGSPVTSSDPTGLIIAECGTGELTCQGNNKVTGVGPKKSSSISTQEQSDIDSTIAYLVTVEMYEAKKPYVRTAQDVSAAEYRRIRMKYSGSDSISESKRKMWLYGMSEDDIDNFGVCLIFDCENEMITSDDMEALPLGEQNFAEMFGRGFAEGLGSRVGLESAGNRRASGGCGPNSFVAGTEVLLADGSSKPIEDVETGDKVLATDPETGRTEAETVAATILTKDDKNYVALTIATENGAATITATEHHPFWSESEGAWLDAGDLRPGMTLRTDDGATVSLSATRTYSADQNTYNLTVSDVHTYYVLAGNTPVLVHNACGDPAHADDCYCNWGEPVVPRPNAAGGAADDFMRHAMQRLEQRGVSAEDAQTVLAREPFSYHHDDQWKLGYYDPNSKVFVAKTVDGNINTVMTNVDNAYINRLQGRR
ncbi:polymorphic toxin-type HINT domain-containing protein [Streptomyces sp. NPDC054841]